MRTRNENIFDSFENLSSFENLYNAHKSCRKGKRWKDSVAIYDIRALESTLYLQWLLRTDRYQISEYNCFQVNERGKVRDIKSTKYKDRVVQKSLYDNLLEPRMMPTLIYANGASQKGKGTDFQIDILTEDLRSFWRRNGTDGYILVCDLKGYFDSIKHKLVDDIYAGEFKDEKVMALIRHIHASIPGGVGVPLGNQLSQIDALLAASPIDHMAKERLGIKYYGRYMDDFYLIHKDKAYLEYCLREIEKMATELGLTLNLKKTKIVPVTTGINFLGFRFYITKTGKVVRRMRPARKNHEKQKLRKQLKKLEEGKMTIEDVKESYESWKAHAARGDTYYLLRAMDKYFNKLFQQYLKGGKGQDVENIRQSTGRSLDKGPRDEVQRQGDHLEEGGSRAQPGSS